MVAVCHLSSVTLQPSICHSWHILCQNWWLGELDLYPIDLWHCNIPELWCGICITKLIFLQFEKPIVLTSWIWYSVISQKQCKSCVVTLSSTFCSTQYVLLCTLWLVPLAAAVSRPSCCALSNCTFAVSVKFVLLEIYESLLARNVLVL